MPKMKNTCLECGHSFTKEGTAEDLALGRLRDFLCPKCLGKERKRYACSIRAGRKRCTSRAK